MKKTILSFFTLSLIVAGSSGALGADLTIKVNNIKNNTGTIGCALFHSADGFPGDSTKAKLQNHLASSEGVTCLFDDLEPGNYAVSVFHDVNENNQTDTNFFGIPTEEWGVSNNARPFMNAPTFEEARFELSKSEEITINID